MKKPALILLAFLGAVLAFVAIRSLGDGRTNTAERPSGALAPDATGALLDAAPLAPSDESLDPATGERRAERSTLVAADEPRERYGEWRTEERWITGTVDLPAGVPADSTLRLLALRDAIKANELYGRNGILERLGRQVDLDQEELDAEDFVGARLFAVQALEPDGSFRIPVPSDARTVWLAVDGRFLFSRRIEALSLEPGTADAGPFRVPAAKGAYVTGHVVLPEDLEDAAGAYGRMEVELGPDSSQFAFVPTTDTLFLRRTRVDTEGRFAFRAVDPDRAYEVAIEAEDLAGYLEDGLLLEPGRVRHLECVLGHGARIAGRVLDPDGTPAARARVTARQTAMWGFPGRVVAETTSDNDGRYELAGIPRGRRLLIASKDGFLESLAETIEIAEREERVDVRLTLTDGNTVDGTARFEDGSPAADAEVTVVFDPEAMMGMNAFNAARGASGRTRTDADGRFAVHSLGKGPFLVRAVHGDEDEDERRLARRSGVKPNTTLELTLARPPVVRGRVQDTGGNPITAFELIANNQGAVFWAPGSAQRRSYVSEEGAFAFDELHEGSWELEVEAAGFGPSTKHQVTVPLDPDAEELVFVLAPAAIAAGNVVDPNGNAVAGARVTLHVEATRSFAQMTGRLQFPETYSEEDGSFTLDGLAEGTQSLVASHPDFAPSSPAIVELEAGGRTDEVVLTLRRGGTIFGESFDREGDPLDGAQVILQNTTNWRAITSRTESDGTFIEDNLTPGQWSVTVMDTTSTGDDAPSAENASSFLENMQFVMVEVEDGGEHFVTLGGRPEDPTAITGQVTHGGEPVAAAMISFFPDGAEGFDAMKFTQLNEEGRYSIELEQPGAYLVQVQDFGDGEGMRQNNVEFSRTVPEGPRHTLDLELPLGSIRGNVRGPDGDPARGVRVTLTTDGGVAYGTFMGGQYAETTCDDAGNYVFEFVRPGTYSVAAGGALFGGALGTGSTTGRMVQDDLRVADGEVLDGVDFGLRAPGAIAGVVTDEAGRPVSGASIFVRDEAGRPLERFSMTASAPDGRFRYVGVSPGRYHVSARTTSQASAQESLVTVSEEGTAEVTLSLGPGTVLLVRVTDKRGDEVRATVLVEDDGGRQVNGMLSYADMASGMGSGFSASEQRIGPLSPGRYVVSAIADDGRRSKKPVELSGQPERKLKLRLKD